MQPDALQDTIEFALAAEHVVVNTTMKLTADIVALVGRDVSEPRLRDDIRAMVRSLVDADWQFSNIQRQSDASGLERVTLAASVRVPETENHALDRRAKEASRPGLSITGVAVDTTVPQRLIDEAEATLRLALAAEARKQQAALGEAMGLDYRIHKIAFDRIAAEQPRLATTVRASSKAAYGSGFGDDEESLGNASKLAMRARVTLARLA